MRVLGPGVVIGSRKLRRILKRFSFRSKAGGARRPVSRVLSAPAGVRDGHSSGMRLTAHLARPTRAAKRECSWLSPSGVRLPPLFGLAPGGVYRAAPVAEGAVRSCRTVSPLPADLWVARAVCFLWHFPWGRPRRPLAGTVFPWSPDFPPPTLPRRRPSGRLAGGRSRLARTASSRASLPGGDNADLSAVTPAQTLG